MIAIPVDSLGENPTISDYFGKSKWFAIIDQGIISFEKNTKRSGCKIADWLYDLGVTQTIITHIGLNPFLKLEELDIECLYSNKKSSSLVEVFEEMENNSLNKINKTNMNEIVDIKNGCDEECE